MKNLIILCGFMLWIPQVWAATIHSVAAGGDWNKAETWVGGQVPDEDDSVVVKGNVIITNSLKIAELTVSHGTILKSRTSGIQSSTLTVNGNIINNGSIKNADNGNNFYINVSGDVTNNGQWNNKGTKFFGDLKTTINGIVPSSEITFDKDLSVTNNNIIFAKTVFFNNHTLNMSPFSTITALNNVWGGINLHGENITFIFKGERLSSFNVTGVNSKLIFENDTTNDIDVQYLSYSSTNSAEVTYNVNHIILSGGIKGIYGGSSITINGSLIVEQETILKKYVLHSNTLIINGDIINNGTIDEGTLYMRISGNILNNGTWNNSRTTLTFPSSKFRMTNTPTWEEPKNTSSYEITDYLTTQHHWQVSADGNTWSEQRGINDPSLVATVAEVTIPEPSEAKPDTPKICETSKPSNASATFNPTTGELYLPQVRINTQYGNLYSISLSLQVQLATSIKFKLTDFCQFDNPLTIIDSENTAILHDINGIIYIPSIDFNGTKFYTNLYLVKTEGWIFKKEIDDLVGEEAILDYNKDITFTVPVLEVISFNQDKPLIPLAETLLSSNKIELSSGIVMMNAILGKFENPLDPEGIYWKLADIEFAPKWGSELTPEVFVHENLDLSIWKHIGRDNYKFTLQHYYNPNDSIGYYWRYIECSTLDKEYLSPGSLFKIDNASCRQKADMHIFKTSILPKLIHLINAYNYGINSTVEAQKFVQKTIDTVKTAYSVTSSIQDIAEVNKLNKIDYAVLNEKLSNNVGGVLQTQLELGTKIAFSGEEYDYVAEGIVHTTNQIITALKSCNPTTGNMGGCTGLFVDLGGDVIGTINNFAASMRLKADTDKLNSVTCTLNYLSEYYSFGGNKKLLAENVGLSQDASNFVIKDVLTKTSVCNSANMDYTLSLIEQYQELIRTTNSLNYISRP